MPSKYQVISEMAAVESGKITSGAQSYMAFLRTAANNYKYDFREQLLIHAQKPTATACAEIEVWNKLGRWVNKGTKGIALLVDKGDAYKLRHVFDVSDTNSYYGRAISLWQMKPRFESAVTETLKNRFGEVGDNAIFECTLLDTAALVVEDNYGDYLLELSAAKDGSLLEELDEMNTSVWFRDALKNSVTYMLFVRCGCDTHRFFEVDDFSRVGDFNTPETVSVLGCAASDISEMVLREIGATVKAMELAEKKEIRTFAKQPEARHNDGTRQTDNSERSFEHGTDIQTGGRLPAAESDGAGGPDNREIRTDAPQVSSDAEESHLHGAAAVREAVESSDGDRPAGGENDGTPDLADGEKSGRDGESESLQSDALGSDDEQHSERSGGDSAGGSDLQLSGHDFNRGSDIPYYYETGEKNELLRTCYALNTHRPEITAFFASHEDGKERGDFIKSFFDNAFTELELKNGVRVGYRAYEDVLQLWRGKFLTREKEDYLRWSHVASIIYGMMLLDEWLEPNEKLLPTQAEQMSLIEQAESQKDSAFSLPQEAIDFILCGGSGFSQGKLRIYAQFALKKSTEENAHFLKQEYGIGGHSDAIPGSGLWENHDGKGITVSRSFQGNDDYASVTLKWTTSAKRIAELIAADRYLNSKEKAAYPAYCKGIEDHAARKKISDEFLSVIGDYNDFQTQIGNQGAALNQYVLSDCARQFANGEKKTWTVGNGNFILPLMREALTSIISEGTHHQERAEKVFEQLGSELAMTLEASFEEMNPPLEPETEKEYRFAEHFIKLGARQFLIK